MTRPKEMCDRPERDRVEMLARRLTSSTKMLARNVYKVFTLVISAACVFRMQIFIDMYFRVVKPFEWECFICTRICGVHDSISHAVV